MLKITYKLKPKVELQAVIIMYSNYRFDPVKEIFITHVEG